MLAIVLELALFTCGFAAVVGSLVYQAWMHLHGSTTQLISLLLALPVLVWSAAFAYHRTYSFVTAISSEQLGWAIAWYHEYWTVEMAPLFSAIRNSAAANSRLAARPSLSIAV